MIPPFIQTSLVQRSLVVRASLTSTDQFQSFRTSYELREFPESHPNLTSVVRVSKTSYGSNAELHEFSRASYVEFARVFQSVLRLLVVRVSRASYGSYIELRKFSRASYVELLCEFTDQDRKSKSNDGFVLYYRLRTTSTHQRL